MTVTERRRATTLAELQVKMNRLVSEAGFAAGLGFVARPSDGIIASDAKCGTAWLQQIVPSLRTGGGSDFAAIPPVVPRVETAPDPGPDLGSAQTAAPRPMAARLAMICQTWSDCEAARHATRKTPRPACSAPLRPNRSPRAPVVNSSPANTSE